MESNNKEQVELIDGDFYLVRYNGGFHFERYEQETNTFINYYGVGTPIRLAKEIKTYANINKSSFKSNFQRQKLQLPT